MASGASRSAAAKQGWKTRRALFAKRSAAAKRGWQTRRENVVARKIVDVLRKPAGRNLTKGGKPRGYRVRKYGFLYRGERFDFRGLTRPQQKQMLQLVLQKSVGHYVRLLIVSQSEDLARRLYVGQFQAYVRRRMGAKQKPYWFWTAPFGEVESTLEAYEHIWDYLEGTDRKVKIVIAEVL